jgi:tRNA threonylcarbamoyl adenosine modification protein (Sua5/YciO/YrdC/YwlC family)
VIALEEAAEALARGHLVVIPTDTVYGLASRPDRPEATARLFEAKRRPLDLELPVLVPSIDAAERVALIDGGARALMEAFWPGPLTVVLPRAASSTGWELGGDRSTVGLRRPRHLLALALLERTGPLAVTSANLSGHPTPSSCEALTDLFGDAVAVYLCQDQPLQGLPSTVVDMAHGDADVLRAGTITKEEIEGVLRRGRADGGSQEGSGPKARC